MEQPKLPLQEIDALTFNQINAISSSTPLVHPPKPRIQNCLNHEESENNPSHFYEPQQPVMAPEKMIVDDSQTMQCNVSFGPNCDVPVYDRSGSLVSSSVEYSSVSGDSSVRKKCLSKEVRPIECAPPPLKLNSSSSFNSLGAIVEEEGQVVRGLQIKSVDEMDFLPHDRSLSVSSYESSLGPIQEDAEPEIEEEGAATGLERMKSDSGQHVRDVSMRRRSSRPKLSLETISEEAPCAVATCEEKPMLVNEAEPVAEKHPMPFPSKQSENTWFDLRSPAIRPSRKRRLADSIDFDPCEDDHANGSEISLPYNVSDYRRTTGSQDGPQVPSDAARLVEFESDEKGSDEGEAERMRLLKLQDLQSKVAAHEEAIKVTSQALLASHGVQANLHEHLIHCHTNLLRERQLRKVMLQEINRLSLGDMSSCESSCPTGNLTISGISLPLKPMALQSLSADASSEHFLFICLLKCPDCRVICSDTVSFVAPGHCDRLEFCSRFNITKVPSSFSISFEIYGMNFVRPAAKVVSSENDSPKQPLPGHDSTSSPFSDSMSTSSLSLSSSNSAKRLRFLKRLFPATKVGKRSSNANDASNASVDEGWRSSGFSLLSSVILTRDEVNEKEFSLQKLPHLYPLSGKLLMNISFTQNQPTIEERGFLSVFSQVCGLASWQRMWCLLQANKLSMWSYPSEEELGSPPVRIIDLHRCLSETVALTPKEVCFRPQTFSMLIASDGGEASRLLISADTKSERIVWCKKLNNCLVTLREWDPERWKRMCSQFSIDS